MNKLIESVKANSLFVLEFLGIVVIIFLIAYVFEKYAAKHINESLNSGSDGNRNRSGRILTTKKIVVVGMFSAIATVLFLFDFPVGFAPAFYKLDFSELPALITAFAYGPVAGVMVEFVKILLKILIKGTDSAFVGELANFVIGSAFILPASIIYSLKKTKKMAVVSCVVGTLMITIAGTVFNAVYLLPAFSKLYGMPLDVIIGMGTAIFSAVDNVWSFVFMCVAPLNLLKGVVISVITILVYKKLSKYMK